MNYRLKKTISSIFGIQQDNMLKVFLLSVSFFLVIGAYTVVRELKDIVFTSLVGCDRQYLAYAKLFSMFILIPTLLFHSRLVDILRKHYLLYFYSLLYGLLGLLFAILLGNSTIGLENTVASSSRYLGWIFYFFVEGYSPLVVSVFWAFANSVTEPQDAKSNYTAMIAGSKLGGMVTAALGCLLLKSNIFTDVVAHQFLLATSSLILMIVPIVVYILVLRVPKKELHGYEAAYKVEKENIKQHTLEKQSTFEGMVSGLFMLFRYPYVLGIFGMSFFFELINQAIKVENIVFVRIACPTISHSTSMLLWQALLVHIVGFIVVVFGTRALIQALGEKWALVTVPLVTGVSVIGFVFDPTYLTAIIAFVVTRSVNYALAVPLRESLYIPTVKAIKFKTKSWIDGVGNKFAKTCASTFNMYADKFASHMLFQAQSVFFSLIVGFWVLTAYLLGTRFELAVKKNEVIGSDVDTL